MACNKKQKPEELQEEQLDQVSGGHGRPPYTGQTT